MTPPAALIALLVAATTSVGANEYCDLSPVHTLCINKVPGPACGGAVLDRGLLPEEAEEIVRVHNELRSTIARGLETRGNPGPQPPAADMLQLEWDAELTRTAQSHADQCIFDHDSYDSRKSARFSVGQNLFIRSTTGVAERPKIRSAVQYLYSEVDLFVGHTANSYGKGSAGAGHYTQIVWAKTAKIGCGFTRWREEGWTKGMLTCNYGPAGNMRTAPLYQVGAACSRCPDGFSCSGQHSGLCSQGGSDEPTGILGDLPNQVPPLVSPPLLTALLTVLLLGIAAVQRTSWNGLTIRA